MPATGAAVELLLDAGWTDITADVYLRDRIKITRGRQDQGARVDPGSCTLTLNNKGGKYSPRNPLSALYGQIGRNTPVRVSAVGGTPWLDHPASGTDYRVSTPSTTALQITGDLDIRFDVESSDWDSSDALELGGKWGAAGQRSWHAYLFDGGVWVAWTTDGTTEVTAGTSLQDVVHPRRLCLRITVDVNNGASGRDVVFYTGPSLSGPWTQLGATQTFTGTSATASSTAAVEIGDATNTGYSHVPGRIYAAQIRSGISGTVVASPDFTAQTPGATSFTDSASVPWTANSAAALTNRHMRFVGEISAWPARWDVSGGDVYVPVQAAGILRRLGQGASPLDSALRRSITDAAPLAYWPLEDGTAATQAASALVGGTPLRVVGGTAPSFASAGAPPGSLPLPDFTKGGALTAAVGGGSAASWTVEAVLKFPAVTDVLLTPTPLLWRTSGTPLHWTLGGFSSDGSLFVQWNNDSVFTSQFYASGGGYFDGEWHHVRVTIAQSGTAITIEMWIDGTLAVSDSEAAFTLGPITAMDVRGNTVWADAPPAVGHVAVWSPATTTDIYPAVSGHDGETAGTRYGRLSTEEDIPFTAPYGVVGTAALGPQLPAAFLDLLDEGADADMGILYEARNSIASAYRPRWSLYNQTPALALDYAVRGEVAPPLDPTEDDTATRNDITVSRPSGSSARATLDTGPLSTLPPPLGVGRYTTSEARNVHGDDQLPDVAGWLLHLGTVDEARYPAVTVNLAAGPWLAGAAMTVDLGDLITIANPPPWLPPDTISLICQGYTETVGVYDWTITYNCTPGSAWTVGVLDDPVLGRADTDGSELAADVDADDTTLSVSTLDGPLWTVDPAETPWDVTVGGETIRVEAVGVSILNAAPWMDDGISGWSAQGTTATVASVTMPRPDGQTAPVLQITPDGTSASGGAIATVKSAVGSITPGTTYTVCLWAYSADGYSDLRAAVDWYSSTGTFLSSGLGSGSSVPAGVWTFLHQTLTAPASASTAQVRARHAGTPSASDVWCAWGIRIMPVAGTQSSPQAMAVTRSRNGVSKAQTAGTDVRLATPMILSL